MLHFACVIVCYMRDAEYSDLNVFFLSQKDCFTFTDFYDTSVTQAAPKQD